METLKEKFGARLKEIRRSKKMTQENLAELSGMDIPNLSNIERGKKFVSAETLSKLALALDIPEQTLFDFGHKKTKQELTKEIYSMIEKSSLAQLEFIHKMLTSLSMLEKE